MKILALFLVGLILLPIMMLPACITVIKRLIIYIKDYGEDFIEEVKFKK